MARGDGKTTEQMRAAPVDAVFVWVNADLHYPRALADKIGRDDLKIVPPSFFDNDRWCGQQFTGIVIDHAACLGDVEWENYRRALAYVRGFAANSEGTK